ncbi:hypothetical protein CR513_51030, partial [Mucuna pruriens]
IVVYFEISSPAVDLTNITFKVNLTTRFLFRRLISFTILLEYVDDLVLVKITWMKLIFSKRCISMTLKLLGSKLVSTAMEPSCKLYADVDETLQDPFLVERVQYLTTIRLDISIVIQQWSYFVIQPKTPHQLLHKTRMDYFFPTTPTPSPFESSQPLIGTPTPKDPLLVSACSSLRMH